MAPCAGWWVGRSTTSTLPSSGAPTSASTVIASPASARRRPPRRRRRGRARRRLAAARPDRLPRAPDPADRRRRSGRRVGALATPRWRCSPPAAAERTLTAGITTVRDVGGWNYVEMAVRDADRRRPDPRAAAVPRRPAAVDHDGDRRLLPGDVRGRRRRRRRAAGRAPPARPRRRPDQGDGDRGDAVVGDRGRAGHPVHARRAAGGGRDRPRQLQARRRPRPACAGSRTPSRPASTASSTARSPTTPCWRGSAERGTCVVPDDLRRRAAVPRRRGRRRAMPEHLRRRMVEFNEVHVADDPAGPRARRRASPWAPTPARRATTTGSTPTSACSWSTQCGLSPAESIRTATVNAARLLRREGELGVLAEGAYADVIAFAATRSTTSRS